MSFPPSFLEELRTRVPLSDIIGTRLRLTRAGREYKGCCPFHNEKTPSFYVSDDKQFYHCFGCGAHGDVIGFLMQNDRMSFPEAVESLAGQAGLTVPCDTPMDREKFDSEKRLYQMLDRTTAWFEDQLFTPGGRNALNYLYGRGLNDDAIHRFRLGYAPNETQTLIRKLLQDRYTIEELVAVGIAKKAEGRNEFYSFFRNRVMFPVGDGRGRTVAFGARVLGDGEPKYLNSTDHPLFHKGKLLYSLSRARTAITQKQPLIVVEGYMDVIAMVEAGYHGTVAPLGTALTEDQLLALWKLLPPAEARDPSHDYSPILCFDGDSAGLRAAARAMERALPLLTSTQTIRMATLTGAKDPDDLLRQSGKASMDMVLEQAKPMIDVIWEMTLTGRSLRTPEERGSFIAAIKQHVSRIANDDLRKLYQDEIRTRVNDAFGWRKDPSQTLSAYRNEPQRLGRRDMPFRKLSQDRNGGAWLRSEPSASLITRKQPAGPQRLRERALLAIIINYPALFDDFGEDLAHIDFSSPEFEVLRQRVIGILSVESQEPLDAKELYRHLSAAGETGSSPDSGLASLTEVLSETTYIHVSFARPDRSLDQARHGWKSIWNKHLREQLEGDLQSASRRYAEEASEENLTRLMALREQVEALMLEDNLNNNADTALRQES
jgi:DNA primase